MNKTREILVVREKYFVIPHWKLPGGYVEPGDFHHLLGVDEQQSACHLNWLFCVGIR